MKRFVSTAIVTLLTVTVIVTVSACRTNTTPATPTATPEPIPTATPTAPVPIPASETTPTVTNPDIRPDILEVLVQEETFSALVSAIESAGLADTLRSTGPLTLLAPTNAAFADLPPAALTDPAVARDVLRYHLIDAALTTDDWTTSQSVASLLGDASPLTILRVTDTVTGTVTGTVTEDVPDMFRVNDAAIITANMMADNGVIHSINAVLIPPGVDLAAGRATVPDANAGRPDIIETAAQRDDLTTLLDGLEAAGLTEMLRGPGPFTLFAPTDAAFGALVEAASADLLLQLDTEPAPFLLYHLAPRYVTTSALYAGLALDTMQGDALSFAVPSGDDVAQSVRIESGNPIPATIITEDILAGNGIIHVIDAVLLPPSAPAEPQ